MQIPIRTIFLGSLLVGAMNARAQSKSPEVPLPVAPPATQPLPPIDLRLHPAAAPQLPPIDLTLHPAASPKTPPIGLAPPPATAPLSPTIDAAIQPLATPESNPILLALHTATASAEVLSVARWVTQSGDNAGLPFLLIDKVNAKVFAFDRSGQLKGAAPALLGMARGDRLLAPNTATMAQMPPQVRITPAGRFVSKLAIDSHGKELLVLDYDASISLHAVVKGTPKEHRAERLSSATAQDNRISFGCINVPTVFYSTIVSPTFTNTKGIVYVLPETSPASQLFGFNAVGSAVSGSGAPSNTASLDARTPQAAVPSPDAR
jgi:hypothetical protein